MGGRGIGLYKYKEVYMGNGYIRRHTWVEKV